MDQELLVSAAHELIKLLDNTTIKPRAAMWVAKNGDNLWRLWITPAQEDPEEHEFYRIVSSTIEKNRDSLHGLDVSDIELKRPDHPAIQGLRRLIRMDGLGSAHFSNNTLNGFFLPDGIVLRMAF